MRIYIDIDGVLSGYHSRTYAKDAVELTVYIIRKFDCHYLSFIDDDIALVGETITLAMRTYVKCN